MLREQSKIENNKIGVEVQRKENRDEQRTGRIQEWAEYKSTQEILLEQILEHLPAIALAISSFLSRQLGKLKFRLCRDSV